MKNSLKRVFISGAAFLATAFATHAQTTSAFTRQDTLRGSITPERAWWDLTYYHLDVQINPADSTIKGVNTVRYKVLEPKQLMQIDLQPPMSIEKVVQNGQELQYNRDGNVYYIQLSENQLAGAVKAVDIYYGGKPPVSVRPPWSGGLTWQKDANGKPFVANSNQGDGASMWWPCKDHMYDEPDSMLISATVPENLIDVSNGRLRGVDQNKDGTRTYHWFISNPINNYGVNVNVADYANFSETYQGEKGELDCNYYVLTYNLDVAKRQFKDVPRMLEAFEHWFGPYPFYEDSYKLVEVPYLGMEHQSSVTYGNGYQNGYLGRDLSGTGWGLKFDYIIIHESGHEWFANNITYKDIADMWVHESFTTYSENLFLDYHYGKEASSAYVIGQRANIQNDIPIIGHYNVNNSGSGDMYFKGANMLHTLRQIVEDDEKWRGILRGLNKDFYHQTVTTAQIENYLSQHVGRDLSSFFNQYLRDIRVPKLEYQVTGKVLKYRWSNSVAGFNMPVKVLLNGKEKWLEPTTNWQELKGLKKNTAVKVDPNFYIEASDLAAQ
ncbi:M1 family metallopeptidase [Pontibacter silvestris]|uniref:M1 family metallopeptidase n=1 Tax=Pontibacter silvestris TaxID=2305183 RepID=A0ABW4WXA3_9BACT|nr:M1 family metallopeptidase [Pontibacter silvestris]MCC9138536.1 M1 family metallopeptidase [Pontibacter silvestris]